MSRTGLIIALRDSRGFTLPEILIAAAIFVIVALAVGSAYLGTQQAFDYGSSQAYVQRQGTLLQERVQRLSANSVAIQIVDCGPNTSTSGTSMLLLTANGTAVCIYQNPKTTNTNADLFLCQATSFASGATCTAGTIENMLTLMRSEVAARTNSQLRIRNLTFTQVTCVLPGGSCSPNNVGRSVVSPLVDAQFELYDLSMYNPQPTVYSGMRFGMSVTARN